MAGVKLTNEEYTDMILVYGKCDCNARKAAEMYAQKYPDRAHPVQKTFRRIAETLRENGSFTVAKRERERPQRTEENVVGVLARVAIEPSVSIRTIEREMGISRASIQRILKEHKMHPYKWFLTQELNEQDFVRRIDFLDDMDTLLDRDPDALQHILWTDESRFYNTGVVNRHNCHYWSAANPHWIHELANQREYVCMYRPNQSFFRVNCMQPRYNVDFFFRHFLCQCLVRHHWQSFDWPTLFPGHANWSQILGIFEKSVAWAAGRRAAQRSPPPHLPAGRRTGTQFFDCQTIFGACIPWKTHDNAWTNQMASPFARFEPPGLLLMGFFKAVGVP